MVNITKIEQLIKNKGWSNTFFAEQFGRSKVWISDMKRGRSLPDENVLQAIADKLDTTVDYLTDKTEQKNKPTSNNADELRLNEKEKELLLAFRNLNGPGREMILRAAGVDIDRIDPKEIE